jgi:hypothetical protein
MNSKELSMFFPPQQTPSDVPDREYFFNVINTIDPEYLNSLIRHAQNQRFANQKPDENPNVIEVTQFWQNELKASPYFSSK